ncbi:MAG: hypothetical protein Q8S73_40400 [Deltaproteobacteria bacterium]|nr:hypothetical protein [Deltaproteobacteria bacterium]
MSGAHDKYLELVGVLRDARRSPSWAAPDDREILGVLEDLFDQLTPEEQDRANGEGWRGWPDLYDAYMEEHPMRERALDIHDPRTLGAPPREWRLVA